MTTPDKEEMPTKHRNAGLGRLLVHEAWPHDIFGQGGCIASANHPDIAKAIVTACNAYEPLREALILAEKADRIHSKCQECEDGAQAPEACGDCFPSADDARVARRNVLKSLGVRMRDVDRARAIKAEPSICNCSQEDVHDYGPCGEDCRSLVVSTLPVNDRHHSAWIVANGSGTKWRYWNIFGPAWTPDREKATRYARREDAEAVHAADEDAWTVQPFVSSVEIPRSSDRQTSSASNGPDDLEPGELLPCPFCGGEPERIDFDEDDGEPENIGGSAITCKRCQCSTAVVFGYKETLFSSWNERAPANARAALKGAPQPASNDYQADASAPALSEKFTLPEKRLPDYWDRILGDERLHRARSRLSMHELRLLLTHAQNTWHGIDLLRGDEGPVIAYCQPCETFPNGRKMILQASMLVHQRRNKMPEHLRYPATHWMLAPADPPGAELNFSNDAERDGVSLKPDTSSQPASEAGKLSTDEVL